MPVWCLRLGSRRRRRERDGRGGARQRYFDPAAGIAHRNVDDLLEAQRIHLAIDGAIGVGDGDADTTDLREIQLGHLSLLLVVVTSLDGGRGETIAHRGGRIAGVVLNDP